MLVKDIYGDREQEYTSLGLSSTLIASSFGKAIQHDPNSAAPSAASMTKADMARSLLHPEEAEAVSEVVLERPVSPDFFFF